MLNTGDTAPDFTLRDQHDRDVTLSALVAERPALVYFYPIDFSPVCTAEACAFRDAYAGVAELPVQVVGISPQGVASHARFAALHSIPFALLADPRKQVIRAWGVDGPFGFGVRRATFLVGPERRVESRVVADLSATAHVDLLRSALKTRA